MLALASKSMSAQNFSARLFRAWHLLQIRKQGGVTQEWLGKRVGRILGEEDLSQSAVSRWFKGAIPDLDTIEAMAKALEVDPGWLAFGEASAAPSPEDQIKNRLKPL